MLQIMSTKVAKKFIYEQLTQMSLSWLLLCLTRIKRDELLVAFGTGAIFKYIPVHQLVEVIGPEIRSALPVLHAITGSDTVSSFDGRGKKITWNTWQSFPKVIEAFLGIMKMPSIIGDDVLCILVLLERFVVLLYERTSDQVSVITCFSKLQELL